MPTRHAPRGLVALGMVLVLLFAAAMAVAMGNRQVLSEQQAALHSARAAQALAAAEAGVDWLVAQINGDTIDTSCRPDPSSPQGLRDRYLRIDVQGRIGIATWPDGPAARTPDPSCILSDRGWHCSCPAGPVALLGHGEGEVPSTFRVRLGPAGGSGSAAHPGTLGLTVRACSEPIQGMDAAEIDAPDACHRADAAAARVDAQATVEVSLGLLSALALPPPSALTVAGAVRVAPAATLRAVNTDPSTGVAVRTGGSVTGALTAVGPAGSTGDVRLADAALAAATPEQLLAEHLGMPWETYREQPAARLLPCRPCTARDLERAARLTPGGVLWVDGDLRLDDTLALGSPEHPVMLVVRGDLTLAAALVVQGAALVTGSAHWLGAAAGARWQGALVVAGDVDVQADALVVHDAVILQRIRVASGSFVRVPGSWRTS